MPTPATVDPGECLCCPSDIGGRSWAGVLANHECAPSVTRGKPGRHNVFVDALDENGQRCRVPTLRIGWSWEGRRPDEQVPRKALDKPDNEPAGNVDLYIEQITQHRTISAATAQHTADRPGLLGIHTGLIKAANWKEIFLQLITPFIQQQCSPSHVDAMPALHHFARVQGRLDWIR